MTQKALKLFQLFLEIFVVYTILNAQLFTALICLFVILMIGRYEKTAFAKADSEESDQTQEEADTGSPDPS
jgi:hypothetical protein